MILDRPDATFIGSPYVDDLSTLEADFAVVGVPFGVPYNVQAINSDATTAPGALRRRSRRFSTHIEHYDFDLDGTLFGDTGATLVDVGDVPGDRFTSTGNRERATEVIRSIIDRGAVPIVLGGDDSVPPFIVAAYEDHGPINVIQIDAHIDYRDEVNGIRDGYSSTMRRITEMPWVNRVFQVGMRGTGSAFPTDLADARAAGNLVVPAEAIHENGIDWFLGQLPADERYFITVDVDGLDPAIAPGTSAPLPGGLTWSQASRLMRGVAQRGRFVGIDFVEHFPSLDVGHQTSDTISRLILNAVGVSARQKAKAVRQNGSRDMCAYPW